MTTSSIKSLPREFPVLRPWPAVLARRIVHRQLQALCHGTLILEDGGEVMHYGEPAGSASLVARIHVHSPRFYADVLRSGSVGAAEAYIDGAWSSDDLLAVIRLVSRNLAVMREFDAGSAWGRKLAMRLFAWLRRNSRDGSRRNIAAHYDLGNAFFEQFLDTTMMYSCARFPAADSSLEEASVHKLDQICRKLGLQPHHHLLEIGTGWGGLAIHAARHFGCRVTTTTISAQQYQYACDRVAAEGLNDRITVLCQDYRDLTGTFDRLVSVEMIEAVGSRYLGTYLAQCARLLRNDGLMLIQAILIPQQRFAAQRGKVDFIQRYIFPGGFLPSLAAISAAVGYHTDLNVVTVDDMTQDYARTLACWRQRFHARRDAILAMGYPESFMRLWEYYLCYCEGGFSERVINTAQICMEKPQYRQTQEQPDLVQG